MSSENTIKPDLQPIIEVRDKDAPFKVGVRIRPFAQNELMQPDPNNPDQNVPIIPILKAEDNLVIFIFHFGNRFL